VLVNKIAIYPLCTAVAHIGVMRKKLSPYVVYNLYTGDGDDQWESSDWSRDCKIVIANGGDETSNFV